MKLTEYADAINAEICISYYPNQSGRWSAMLKGCEIMLNGGLLSDYGNGGSPEEAISAYEKKIAGRRIAIGAYTGSRREFVVPESLGRAYVNPLHAALADINERKGELSGLKGF